MPANLRKQYDEIMGDTTPVPCGDDGNGERWFMPRNERFYGLLVETLKDEVNVKGVLHMSKEEAAKYLKYTVVPDFKSIGAKFRKLVPAIKVALAKADATKIQDDLDSNGVTRLTLDDGQEVELSREDVNIMGEVTGGEEDGIVGACKGGFALFLDVRLTPELIEEGWVAEVIHGVNEERKECQIPYDKRIGYRIIGNEALSKAFLRQDMAKMLFEDTLATEISFQIDAKPDGEFEIAIYDLGRGDGVTPFSHTHEHERLILDSMIVSNPHVEYLALRRGCVFHRRDAFYLVKAV